MDYEAVRLSDEVLSWVRRVHHNRVRPLRKRTQRRSGDQVHNAGSWLLLRKPQPNDNARSVQLPVDGQALDGGLAVLLAR